MSEDKYTEKSLSDLIAEINAAFDGVCREDGITLHEALAIDDRKSFEEMKAARQFDTDQQWQTVRDEDLLACESALSFLDAKGFRYYLPAFMLQSLKDWQPDSSGILDSCVYHLLHEPQKSLRKSEPAQIAAKYSFTVAQIEAIARFLRFIVGEDTEFSTVRRPILQAVEKWEEFVKDRKNK